VDGIRNEFNKRKNEKEKRKERKKVGKLIIGSRRSDRKDRKD